MLDTISENIGNQLFEAKLTLSAINLAMRNAKSLDFDSSKMARLASYKTKIYNDKKALEFNALSELVTQDVDLLSNGWMAIAYYKDNNKNSARQLFLTPLKNISVSEAIDVLNKNQNNISPQKLFKNYIDEQQINIYRLQVNNKAVSLLQSIIMEESKQQYKEIITAHAFKRWCERILNNLDSNSLSISERKKVLQDIHKDFSSAKLKYSQKETSKDFYLNEDSMIIYCVKKNTIISIWKNDFGFSCDDINASITLKQFEYINKKQNDVEEENNNLSTEISNIEETISNQKTILAQLKEELFLLKEKIEDKEQDIQLGKEQVKELQNKINQSKKDLMKEENILFKKFKPEALVEDNDYSIIKENIPEIKMDLNFSLDEDNDIYDVELFENKKEKSSIILLDIDKPNKPKEVVI